MSRESSPPPLSDDSAVGSISSSVDNAFNVNKQVHQPRPKITRPSAKDLVVNSDDLELAAKQMRTNNVSLISRSIRTVLSCFDDLDVQRFESRTDYLINFISNGINHCTSSVLRPVSILWPDYYEKMVEQLAILDAYLLNTSFKEKPVDWMLERKLTTIPNCRQCNDKMKLKYPDSSENIVRWQCQKFQACSNYLMPVQRPSFFSNFESIGLDKLLFSIYYWATCTPGEELYAQMNIEPNVLNNIWRRIQNVCRTALEKSYPRHRLTNVLDKGPELQSNEPEPIDLISIKLNDIFVVCAKHPSSNLVRLGLYIPNVSLYSFVDLTESWFAHGAQIRVSESKFIGLMQKRTDLKVQLVPRLDMIAKDGQYYRNSAFGYLICQLAHVLRDFDSSSLSRESLRLVLAEMQWRELYGTTPYDAFTNIVNHMAQYGEASDWYSEPSLPVEGEESIDKRTDQVSESLEASEYTWAEKYFYASVDPVDAEGKVVCRYMEPPNIDKPPEADVRILCHECNLRFECFDFAFHLRDHIEAKRKDTEGSDRRLFECKHCFKIYPRDQMIIHSTLFTCQYHNVKYGCRICCIKLNDRASYLQHMRQLHFEHETPYRCPSCLFAHSFQKDVYIHFQEEHRHSMIILCPMCLRSFSVAKPELMTRDKMSQFSKIIYNHLAEHYIYSRGFACSNCCLCFLNKTHLMQHKQLHHNPLEIRPLSQVKVDSFIVTREEEKYCVKALPVELFIANKRPNKTLDPVARVSSPSNLSSTSNSKKRKNKKPSKTNPTIQVTSQDGTGNVLRHEQELTSSSASLILEKEDKNLRPDEDKDERHTITISDSEDDNFCTNYEEGLIHVRGLSQAEKFLQGGEPDLRVSRSKSATSGSATSTGCSSQKLIDYLSKMKRADSIVPNKSVILTPKGVPARCSECFHFITIDHFVASINCGQCKYSTHCPRASTIHNKKLHHRTD